MDILAELEIENEFLRHGEQEAVVRGRRRFKTQTCAMFYDEMSDFEFERTFRFSKEGVRHLTALLGNSKFSQ